MATKLKSADIVVVGLGWTGGILARQLAETGLSIVVLERGGPRDTNPDFMYPTIHDELRYAQRHELMQNVSRETLTFRNITSETALPMRQLGSFLPGEGVGGAGVHWNGHTWTWEFSITPVQDTYILGGIAAGPRRTMVAIRPLRSNSTDGIGAWRGVTGALSALPWPSPNRSANGPLSSRASLIASTAW